MEVASVGRQIGLRLVGPEGVESLGDVVVAYHIPVPARGLGVGGVDVRPGAIVGQAVGRRAVGKMHEPSVVEDGLVVAVLGNKARPNADHGVEVHRVQIAIHGDGIGPLLRIHVHLAHLGVVEPVDHQYVRRQMAVAIAFGHGHQFCLAGVSLLALDVAVGRLGKHRHIAGQQVVAGVDLVVRLARDDKERDALANIRCPLRLIVEAEAGGRLAGIVPDQTVAFVGDDERHADALAGGCVVVVRTAQDVAATVEKSLLILAEAVVVFVLRRGEGCTDLIEGIIGCASVVEALRGSVLVVRQSHLPVAQIDQCRAIRSGDGNAQAGRRSVEELRNVRLGSRGRVLLLRSNGDDELRGAHYIAVRARIALPSVGVRARGDAVARRGGRVLFVQADADAHDVLRVRLDHHGGCAARDDHLLCLCNRQRSDKRQRACRPSRSLPHSHLSSKDALN